MLFHTWVFFIFFAVVYAVYLPLRKNNAAMNLWLVIASYFFYGWRRPHYLLLFFGTSAIFGGAAFVRGEVTAYPSPIGLDASPDYRVRVDNKDIFVLKSPAFSMATFAFTGEAEVVVDVQHQIKNVVIRPLALGIKATVDENKLRFRISRPCHLAIEVDDDLRRPLFLFANAPDVSAPRQDDPGVHYFEGGRIHDVGKIELKDNETLYLAGGAVVRGMIRANHVSGIRILGPGILDASTRSKQTELVTMTDCRNVEINGPIVLGSHGWSIVPRLSENIRLYNVKVVSWRDNDDGFDPDSSRHVTVENCFFRTKDDCIAVKAHSHFENEGKNTGDNPDSFNTEDVLVTKSTFWSSDAGHALTVGFAVSAPVVRNVVFRDCDIIKKEKGWAMSIDNHDLGSVENVRFENIHVEDGCDKLLAVKVAFSEYSADCPFEYFRNNPARKEPKGDAWQQVLREKRSSARGTVRNVLFKDIKIGGERLPGSDIVGFSPHNDVSDVVFENLTFQGKILDSPDAANLRIQNAANVRFEK